MYLTRFPINYQIRKVLGDLHLAHKLVMSHFPEYETTPRAQAQILWAVDPVSKSLLIQSAEEIDGADSKELDPLEQFGVYNFTFTGNPIKHKDRHRFALKNEVEQVAWLRRKLGDAGMTLLSGAVTNATTMKGNRRGSTVTAHTVRFVGRLEVFDAALAEQARNLGIGKAKAYGCGILLLDRDDRQTIESGFSSAINSQEHQKWRGSMHDVGYELGEAGRRLERDFFWIKDAACGNDVNKFFDVRGVMPAEIKEVCAQCPVRAECLKWGYSIEEPSYRSGIFGGFNANQRNLYTLDELLHQMNGTA